MLTAEAGDSAFAFPHHIAYRLGARGINWSSFDAELSPVIEILSMHGCSETSVMDRPFLHSMGPGDGHGTARHGLGLGHRFGFLGNTDHHSGYPGSYGHGRSVIYTSDNDRDKLWNAIQERRSCALTGDRSHLFFTLGGVAIGGEVEPGVTPVLEVEAVAGGQIDYIDVIRGGDVVARVTPDLTPAPIDGAAGAMETILVLELGWGSRGTTHAWHGTLELAGGEILSVEPRLRGSEIVSPLEGDADGTDDDFVSLEDDRIEFAITAFANPNNMTPATQAIAARIRIAADARFVLETDGQRFEVSADRLLHGALSGNLRPDRQSGVSVPPAADAAAMAVARKDFAGSAGERRLGICADAAGKRTMDMGKSCLLPVSTLEKECSVPKPSAERNLLEER